MEKLLIQQKVTIASQFDNLSSEIDVQNQQLKNAKINQQRISNLYKEGAATQKQLDDVNGVVDLIKIQIVAINTKRKSISDQIKGVEIQIEQINEAMSKCNITNPVTGTVLVKYAEQGEIAGIGKPLYKIADLSQMKLKAYIFRQKHSKSSYKWELVVLLWCSFFLHQGDRQIYNVVIPLIKADLHLTDIQLGLIATIFTLVYGICVPFAGYAGDVIDLVPGQRQLCRDLIRTYAELAANRPVVVAEHELA